MKSPLSKPHLATQTAEEMDDEIVDFLFYNPKNQIYKFRRRVPEDVIKYFPPGYKEISRSLGKISKTLAKEAGRSWGAKTDSVFQFLRSAVSDLSKKDFLAAEIPANKTPTVTVSNLRVSDLVKQYLEYKAPTIKLKSLSDYDNAFNLYIECCGDTYLRSMDYKDIEKFRDLLSKLPPNLTTSKKYKTKTVKDILAMPDNEKELLNPRSVNKILGFFSTLIKFGVRRGLVRVNFAEGINVKEIDVDLAVPLKDEYTADDIQFIINSLRWDAGNPSHMYVPLCLIFTGARRNEMCQLYTSDIEIRDGIPCFNINGMGEKINYVGKSGKMKGRTQVISDKDCKKQASWRLIPIHPFLWDNLGFSGYVETCKKSGHKRLFPELTFHRDGYGTFFSKWFDPEIAYKIAPPGSKKTLHSLRHSFQNWFKQNPAIGFDRTVADEVLNEIIGHAYNTNKKVLHKEIYGKKYPPETTSRLVYQLDYGIEFSNLTEQPAIAYFASLGSKAEKQSKLRPGMDYPTEVEGP